jgi:hypothetical protein
MSLTAQDYQDYGSDFIDLTRRAAADVVGPAIQQLRAENQQLRQATQRSQRADIERALDQSVGNWREVYQDPRFSSWLSQPDPYSGETRSQLMRRAVANGDTSRVVAFYRGYIQSAHQALAGQQGQRSYQSRPAAPGSQILTRPQIADLYDRRRKGLISDADWPRIEHQIFAAANTGRVAGAINLTDGTEISRTR